jgi:hypothetical protein
MVIMPKCPMCVAAYIALFTGAEVTIATARWIQIAMWAVCLLSLGYLTLKLILHFKRNYYVNRTSHAR